MGLNKKRVRSEKQIRQPTGPDMISIRTALNLFMRTIFLCVVFFYAHDLISNIRFSLDPIIKPAESLTQRLTPRI